MTKQRLSAKSNQQDHVQKPPPMPTFGHHAPTLYHHPPKYLTPEKLLAIQRTRGNHYAIQLVRRYEEEQTSSRSLVESLALSSTATNTVQPARISPIANNPPTIQRTIGEVVKEIALKIGVPATIAAIAAFFGAPTYIVYSILSLTAPGAVHMVISKLMNWRGGDQQQLTNSSETSSDTDTPQEQDNQTQSTSTPPQQEIVTPPDTSTNLPQEETNQPLTSPPEDLRSGVVIFERGKFMVEDDIEGKILLFDKPGVHTPLTVGIGVKYTIEKPNKFLTKAMLETAEDRPPSSNSQEERRQERLARIQEITTKNYFDLSRVELRGIRNVSGARKHYNDPMPVATSDQEVFDLLQNAKQLNKIEIIDVQEAIDKFKIGLGGKDSILGDIVYTNNTKTNVANITVFHVGPST